ncbi:putative ABC transporter ATP-binding protein YxlF [Clostridium saccharobutylicum]|uniref:ABC transporter ATP-binding protein n=1 Tax=Clostridium saccharobutylicum TaxID=169679 RepID=UPI000983A90D|nr:ATP-binding cassette domain-containing protein [Clostridium saccharobutylicum]AQS10283.1 putative ABC transporter ATP-binding protein YxlF [Clostridium saccharobutylicum]MBC2436549.1 ATP-binding cassette domain-containing protein [Clostridium saccharobutylicum]NSB87681.1 ABC-type multidrug transport system ATPase subunit [Clostridium saccharobutylicum]NYC31217.1 ABC-type multidrug transport system ATPase subunit [Clostridium saccharobutylicum]OOM17440.1 putative ABC transporter ATP-binding 
MSKEIIAVKNLTKMFKKRRVINNMTFQVNEGDICGFIGPNGAGKTTLIRLLTGLISPSSGSLYLNKIDVTKNREEALKSLGAIVESPIFFEYLTGEKALLNLAMLNDDMNKEERKEKVKEVIKIVGLEGREKDKVKIYSLGMKQRLGIAQALLNNPKIIILDEPANGLDPLGMIELRKLILKLNKEKNITFFISSHILDELQKICNKLIIIKEGSLVWSGNTDELLSKVSETNKLEDIFVKLMTSN